MIIKFQNKFNVKVETPYSGFVDRGNYDSEEDALYTYNNDYLTLIGHLPTKSPEYFEYNSANLEFLRIK